MSTATWPGKGTCGALIGTVLAPNDHAVGGPDEASCSFTAPVTGPGGSTHTDVVTVIGHDDDGQPVTPRRQPWRSTPLIDLYVTKDDARSGAAERPADYTIVVGNNGPDTATQATLADPLPAGTTFVSVSTTQGSCTGGALVNCNLGTIAKGQTVTITLVVTANQAGTLTNTVTVVGKEPESNTANNRDTDRHSSWPRCRASRRSSSATPSPPRRSPDRRQEASIVVRVTAGGEPAKGRKVVVKGAGISKSARTNARCRADRPSAAQGGHRYDHRAAGKLVCGAKQSVRSVPSASCHGGASDS